MRIHWYHFIVSMDFFFLLTSFTLFLIRCYFDKIVKREVLHEYILPMEGHSRLCAIGNIEIFGTYEITEENDIRFSRNWRLFCQVTQFRVGDLVVIKVQVRPQYIKLFFEWVGFRHVRGLTDDEDESSDEDGSSDEVDEFTDELMEYIY